MWKKLCVAFVVAAIGGTLLSIKEVGAQSTVDDSGSCESSTFDEALNLIREDLKDVKLIREDLKDVKNLVCASQQRPNAAVVDTSSLCEQRLTY